MSRQLKGVVLAAAFSGAVFAPSANATCSSEPMLGSICIVAYNFCPRGYADAAGQILSIAQNTALFSLLGTQFGGNGQTTFALPDLRGRVPVGVGSGPGLSSIVEGQMSGSETTTLTVNQMPAHSHAAQLYGTSATGNTDFPNGAVPARLPRSNIYNTGSAGDAMSSAAISVGSSGGSQPFSVRDPYLGLRYCIALQGIYPSRN